MCKSFCVYRLLCVKASVCKSCCVCGGLCVCVCVYLFTCVNMFLCVCSCLRAYQHICMFVFFHIFNNLLYSIPCLSLATKTLASSHLLILASTQNEPIHMMSSNILMHIFMQVFGICKSYNHIHSTSEYLYTPTRSRANHRLVLPRRITHADDPSWICKVKCSDFNVGQVT